MTPLQKSICKTLAYADVFDYPLTAFEIWQYLISSKEVKKESVQKDLDKLVSKQRINRQSGYYFFFKRKRLVSLRRKRAQWSRKKELTAQKASQWLRLIPWVKMVAISGALAVDNVKKNDDIDLLIATKKNRLWLTRLMVIFLIELVAQRRRPGDQQIKDKICLNMFLDGASMMLPDEERNLFTAHEISQLKLLWDKENTYDEFFRKNQWLKQYLANWPIKGSLAKIGSKAKLPDFCLPFERLAYRLQLIYMKSRRTSEVIEPGRARFHPRDVRKWVLNNYQQRLKKFKIE